MGLYVWKFGYRKVLEPLAKRLVWVDPDHVSYAATVVAFGTALCFIFAGKYPVLLLIAIGTIFLRMTLNTIDGVMAIQRGKKTLFGEIVNALPDRYSDVYLMLGLTLSPLVDPLLGIFATASVFLVSYTGMLGKAIGVNWQHQGPLGKVERLILVMIFTLLQCVYGGFTLFGWNLSALSWCMLLFMALGQVTVFNRLRGQAQEVMLLEWPQDPARRKAAKEALVVYDSHTGNTAKIATRIATALGAACRKVDEVDTFTGFSLVIFCSPNIRAACTAKLSNCITKHARDIKKFAVVMTYGAPGFGLPTSYIAAAKIERLFGKRSSGIFVCKGYHAKFKTYGGHPDDAEMSAAVLFAIRLAKRIK